jgi:hypothetical protein
VSEARLIFRYRKSALYKDYARSAIGLILTAGPLFLEDIVFGLWIILIVVAFLFLLFGLRTAVRQAVAVELGGESIRLRGPISRVIPWRELSEFRLDYFSTRRDREDGWM